MTLLLPLLAFLGGLLVVSLVAVMLRPARATAIDRRVREVSRAADARSTRGAAPVESAVRVLQRIGQRLPTSRDAGSLRTRLIHAGYRRSETLPVFMALRIGVAIGAFALFATPVLGRPNLAFAAGALGLGYVLPGIVLARLARRRQHRIQLALADALDLLVVSVEAGLGLDQALARVGGELQAAYPELSHDLHVVSLELLAGTARSDALRNLAERTGVEDLRALVAMLVQTDKFGTSVASSLRVFSETLRTKRRQRAEEAAAKTGVKMVFPLVLCIFPAIWVVTIGPAAIQFVKVLFPIVQGGQP